MKYRHILSIYGSREMEGHLAKTLCGRTIVYGRQPNVPRGDARFCPKCAARNDALVFQQANMPVRG